MTSSTNDDLSAQREALVHSLRGDITDERVLAAMGRVPRERFVLPEARELAYADRPLPIGHGQTISQPRMVALTLASALIKDTDRVLEVGTGSGYQAALLAELAREVVGVELIEELVSMAHENLRDAGYGRVEVYAAQGEELGWAAGAPYDVIVAAAAAPRAYDVIVVAAAAPRVPMSLVDQLAPGGRLVLPVGDRESQHLVRAEKRPEGVVVTRLMSCRFVPLIGSEAFHKVPEPDSNYS
jgi:protein-L-isoaspartate(D-aspartate) O-methyltransferase